MEEPPEHDLYAGPILLWTLSACLHPLAPASLYEGRVTVVWSGEPVTSWDDGWDLADVYDPEVDLLDDLYASGD